MNSITYSDKKKKNFKCIYFNNLLYLTWNVSGSILAIDVNILNTALVTFNVAVDNSSGPSPLALQSPPNNTLYKTGITPNSSVFLRISVNFLTEVLMLQNICHNMGISLGISCVKFNFYFSYFTSERLPIKDKQWIIKSVTCPLVLG